MGVDGCTQYSAIQKWHFVCGSSEVLCERLLLMLICWNVNMRTRRRHYLPLYITLLYPLARSIIFPSKIKILLIEHFFLEVIEILDKYGGK